MRKIVLVLGIWLGLCGLAVAAPAASGGKPAAKPAPKPVAKNDQDDQMGNGDNLGSISVKDMVDKLQMLEARTYGIVVRFILPKGWELKEAKTGKDPKTGAAVANDAVYAVTSSRPMPDPKEPTDFIFELDVFKPSLRDNIPKDTAKDKIPDAEMDQIKAFLNTQVSYNLKEGLKLTSSASSIQPKPYGPQGRQTAFFPIFYDVPPAIDPHTKKASGKGAKLFTFTGFEGDHVYMFKFLISADMVDQHGALIALMMDNAWAVTEETDKAMMEKAKEEAAKQAQLDKNKPPAKPAGK